MPRSNSKVTTEILLTILGTVNRLLVADWAMDRGNSRQQNTELMTTTELNRINLYAYLPLDYKNGSL